MTNQGTTKLKPLPEKLRPLLEEVATKRNPKIAAAILTGDLGRLTARDYRQLRQSLGDELCLSGLAPNDEPNERGYQIEDLIEWAGNRIRWLESHDPELR